MASVLSMSTSRPYLFSHMIRREALNGFHRQVIGMTFPVANFLVDNVLYILDDLTANSRHIGMWEDQYALGVPTGPDAQYFVLLLLPTFLLSELNCPTCLIVI